MRFLVTPLLALLLLACNEKEEHHHHTPKLKVVSPRRTDVALTREYVSQIQAIRRIELRALERGYLEQIFVDEGQMVKQGERMFQLMPSFYEAELNQAKAEAQFAQIEYDNTQRLAQKNVVAASELALAKAKLEKANSQLALAQVRLKFTQLTAPFDGLVGRLGVRQGSLLEEGELLTTVADNQEMWVYFNVPEAEYIDYKTSKEEIHSREVRLRMANNQMFSEVGKITAVEADFNNETGNIAFRATFPNPQGLLRHGQTGSVLMDVPMKNVLIIPQRSTFEVLDQRYVFVVDEKRKVHAQQLKVAAELPDVFILYNGLHENDSIVFEGVRNIRDGQTIIPDPQDQDAVYSNLKTYAE